MFVFLCVLKSILLSWFLHCEVMVLWHSTLLVISHLSHWYPKIVSCRSLQVFIFLVEGGEVRWDSEGHWLLSAGSPSHQHSRSCQRARHGHRSPWYARLLCFWPLVEGVLITFNYLTNAKSWMPVISYSLLFSDVYLIYISIWSIFRHLADVFYIISLWTFG